MQTMSNSQSTKNFDDNVNIGYATGLPPRRAASPFALLSANAVLLLSSKIPQEQT